MGNNVVVVMNKPHTEHMEMIYHATYSENADSIQKEGLREMTFFANTAGYAAAFLAMRGGKELVGTTTIEVDGRNLEVPHFIQHDEIVVFAVDPNNLPIPPVISDDHAAMFYPDDLVCYVSEAGVAPEHIVLYRNYKISELLEGAN